VAAGAPSPAPAASTRVLVFNANPNGVYQVRKNTSTLATTVASSAGSVALTATVAAGDRISFTYDPDTNLQPPTPPIFTSLTSGGTACAVAAWMPSGDPTVVGYVVSYGARSVASGQASEYDQSIETAASTHSICSLPAGRYYVAVQAKNYAGMKSAYSSERSVDITALPVLISMFDATLDGDGVRLTWRVVADEVVRGYRIYRSERESVELPLLDRTLAPDATAFVDTDLKSATKYTYVLAAVKENGDEVRSVPASVTTPALEVALAQNVPNPFNPTTTIGFTLAALAPVTLRVYDARGALVASLFEGKLGEGQHTVDWAGTDNAGQPVASGTYFYVLTTGKQRLSRKMVLLK
jgi:hypothetical protein